MRHRRHRQIAEVNMVPMIDVMLVLVLILMLCVPLLEQHLAIKLPDITESKTASPQKKSLQVNMDRKKNLVVKTTSGKKHYCRLKTLSKCFSTWPASPPMVEFRADRSLSYGDVMQVMGKLQHKGVAGLSLIYLPK